MSKGKYQIIDVKNKVFWYSSNIPVITHDLVINRKHTDENVMKLSGYKKL